METVTSKLEALGYTVHGRQLPAIGNPNPPKDLSEDIAAVRSMVEEAIGDGNDVVVIPHSWGGVVAGSALVGLGKKEREAEGKKGGVTKAGYMAAFIVPEGVSLMDSLPGVLDWWDIDGPHVRATDPNIFYNDLSESEQKHWQSQLQTHALATFYAKSTGAGWRNIPTDYLVCEDDLAIPAAAQEGMVKAVKEAGADIEITRIKAGHSPFLSKPDETVAWIQKVAGD
ncbi:Alpha/beta hydrolase fold-1 [Pyrenochaeta sp. MPI-SDFR-AT-0127]|nr:Alpha/beta hydrolase fold-1 [Pyrenochaeta sp. MPI-SDFR-AT-0127]